MVDLWKMLNTERTILRRMTEEDLEFVYAHFGDEEVCEYMVDNEPVKSKDEAMEIITWSHSNKENPDNNRWIIELKESGKAIGTIGFHRWDKGNNTAEIGYDLNKGYWGKGIMSEAMKAALKFGFEEMKLNRIQAFVHVENLASYYILRSKGFQAEGIIKDMYLYRGKYHDHYMLALLARDYK